MPVPFCGFDVGVLLAMRAVFAAKDCAANPKLGACVAIDPDADPAHILDRLALNAYVICALVKAIPLEDTRQVAADLVDQARIVTIRTVAPYQLATEWYIEKVRECAGLFRAAQGVV